MVFLATYRKIVDGQSGPSLDSCLRYHHPRYNGLMDSLSMLLIKMLLKVNCSGTTYLSVSMP